MSQSPEDKSAEQKSSGDESATSESSQDIASRSKPQASADGGQTSQPEQKQEPKPAAPSQTVSRPPLVGTPTPRPSTPVSVARPAPARPASTSVMPGRPTVPAKPKEESKADVTRRNFLRGLAIAGGLVALGQFGLLGPFLTGSVGQQNVQKQQIFDAQTGGLVALSTTNPPANDWRIFVYPKKGDQNIDNDTFRQCVLIHLPKGYVAPTDLAYQDPKTGDYFVAFSRVCVHLWCLWSYVPTDRQMECPCHGSRYVPGGPSGSLGGTEPGIAVGGPASLQTAPNNQLPVILLSTDANGNFFATGIVGQIGCGQKC